MKNNKFFKKLKETFTKENIFSKETLRKIMLLICIGVFIYSSSIIVIKVYKDYAARRRYEQLKQTERPDTDYFAEQTEDPKSFDLIKQDGKIEHVSVYPKAGKYEPGDTLDINGKSISYFHDVSLEINPEVVGYIKLEGPEKVWIEYPVLQKYTDNDYYLNHSIDHTIDNAASIFMDYRNRIYLEDKNTILYGHNMRDKSMFAYLHNYASWSFAKDHRKIIFNTLYEDMEWEVFASYESHINFDYIRTSFRNDEDFQNFIDECISKSTHNYRVRPKATDRILTLSTCARGDRKEYRYVVQAVLVKRTPK